MNGTSIAACWTIEECWYQGFLGQIPPNSVTCFFKLNWLLPEKPKFTFFLQADSQKYLPSSTQSCFSSLYTFSFLQNPAVFINKSNYSTELPITSVSIESLLLSYHIPIKLLVPRPCINWTCFPWKHVDWDEKAHRKKNTNKMSKEMMEEASALQQTSGNFASWDGFHRNKDSLVVSLTATRQHPSR